jgi:hypothetical protein
VFFDKLYATISYFNLFKDIFGACPSHLKQYVTFSNNIHNAVFSTFKVVCHFFIHSIKGKTINKYHTVKTVLKPKGKVVERSKIDTPNTQKHDCSLS